MQGSKIKREDSNFDTICEDPSSKGSVHELEMKAKEKPIVALQTQGSLNLEEKFKTFDNFDNISSFLEVKENGGERRSDKMTEYFINELNINKENSRKKTWRKNFFIIIMLVKNFVTKMKKKIPNSRFVVEERHLSFINDKSYFYVDESKQNAMKIKKRTKFHKVII